MQTGQDISFHFKSLSLCSWGLGCVDHFFPEDTVFQRNLRGKNILPPGEVSQQRRKIILSLQVGQEVGTHSIFGKTFLAEVFPSGFQRPQQISVVEVKAPGWLPKGDVI